MWPGQQQPGEPGQPNPYQRPGYPASGPQQPNPYAPQQRTQAGGQPGTSPYGPFAHTPSPPYGPGGAGAHTRTAEAAAAEADRKRTRAFAIGAVAAVVTTAVITGAVVLGTGDTREPGAQRPEAGAGVAGSTGPESAEGATEPEGAGEAGDPAAPGGANPREGGESVPTVKGWKVVTNPKHGTRFDVPPDWSVSASGMSTFVEDRAKGGGTPLITMSAPAHLKPESCTGDTDGDGVAEPSGRATVGTKGAKGARDTATAARGEAAAWAWGAYAQTEPKETVRATPARPFTTASGLKGSLATATAAGVRGNAPCATDGKSAAFTFKDPSGEFRTWVLYADAGVPDEIPDATVERILRTLRLSGTPTG
ncbi:hypothetical protein I3J09_25380 [Streptomyces clavuligerus]|uniref:Putative membrane protein n=1 Tax=Streptomyces clavuligerus TaxID=1901 RepID=B5H3U7_STRCL|nr:hypothetical protein [Streptomyces clavuligerus]ANW21241.1 hypothetical protein BB341_25050 [Streptomyces clavuligerus]AXU15867.1 hypothetical protein D1794_26025 [Streptomyces clavuligerus]EDY53243.1 conserved hypothetical protein [Streptomyces clavuligerus]EFG05645.1 Putative membrane protein [Streptomyces clavuligerus]MBY6305991.1 hypothetical protein [Streptomyces clavuligerus]